MSYKVNKEGEIYRESVFEKVYRDWKFIFILIFYVPFEYVYIRFIKKENYMDYCDKRIGYDSNKEKDNKIYNIEEIKKHLKESKK